ncbi:MAG TPA: TlpA disulfide reductase family protein [Spirochaetota bacterium]|nr:TlpA disulfide reductase family protein [Spirochaetota bacterium]HPI21591.1 TlpA disulfide reductase family protein [Spirochaetota bacterium]
MKTRIVGILFICIILIALPLAASPRRAQGFALLNRNNQLVTLSSLVKKGNVIISFWATYCVPCKREMPELSKLAAAYRDRKRVGVLFVSIDKEGKSVAQPFLDALNIADECVFDIYQETAKRYIPSLKVPAVFLVNEKGMIVFEAVGETPETLRRLEDAIKLLPDR